MMAASPYKGLQPYGRKDQGNFFGREAEKELLIGRILAHKLTLLYAATGAGKSSLLAAAVMPELEDLSGEDLDVVYHRSWLGHPVEGIASSIQQTLHRRKKIAEADLSSLDGDTLPTLLRQCEPYASEPLVLVLDQFEELFRYHADEPYFPNLIRQLAQVMTDPSLPVVVVLSMREDFLAELSVFREDVPDLFANYYRLQKLTPQQVREAIVRPVTRGEFGFDYEASLLERLSRDLSARENAPLDVQRPESRPDHWPSIEGPQLQIVCNVLWEQEKSNPDKVIRLDTYERLGGAEKIVRDRVEGLMRGWTPAERRLASRAFAFLVTENGAKMAYPENVLAQILKVKFEKLQPVLHKLNEARILRDEQRPDGLWYELYHDVIARIIWSWNEAFRDRRRRTLRNVIGGLAAGLLLAAGTSGYQLYWQSAQRADILGNRGKLHIENTVGAALELSCIWDYEKNEACSREPLSVETNTLSLSGPADYMLTARKDSWKQQYPVYIEGFRREVRLRVEPPPGPPPDDMAYIPAGVFRMGDKDENDGIGGGDEEPAHDVYVSGFYIDKYEVTNAAYQQCVAVGDCKAPHYGDGSCYRVVEEDNQWRGQRGQVDKHYQEENKPVVCVDWQQAKTYCEAEGKQLPTEAEWEKAAAGPEGYKWSFGNQFDGTKANFCDENCRFDWRDGKVDDSHSFTAPVGTYPKNGYGLFDMSGNVWEWVEDVYDETFYGSEAAKRPDPVRKPEDANSNDVRRVVRGGAWDFVAEGLRAASRLRGAPEDRVDSLGFRCARSPR